ncbi:MAG: hypothetical protein EOP92_23290, partial [Lysobacteraceae bacterium]
WILVPANIAGSKPASLLTQLAVLKKPRLLLVYAITTLARRLDRRDGLPAKAVLHTAIATH